MSLNFIFQIFDFHNLKIGNNIFFFTFEGGLLSKNVYITNKFGELKIQIKIDYLKNNRFVSFLVT